MHSNYSTDYLPSSTSKSTDESVHQGLDREEEITQLFVYVRIETQIVMHVVHFAVIGAMEHE